MTDIAIPYGAYWSTPFAKWQGSLAHLHSLRFAAHVARDAMKRRNLDPAVIDYGVFGQTVPQNASFYGLPWLMAEMGAGHVGGPTVNQACATSARILAMAADEVTSGGARVALAISGDRVSNGPHIIHPDPSGPGGSGVLERWVLDNFGRDPATGKGMIQTAENVARKYQVSTSEQNDVVIRRHEQYRDALKDDHAFQRRYMDLPFAVPDAQFRKTKGEMAGDEGVHPTTMDGLKKLKPVLEDGSITFGGQTHPADGSAAVIVTDGEQARSLSRDPGIAIRVISFGQARAEPAYMPEAPIPAAQKALDKAGLTIRDIDAIKSHNPFVVNDIAFARAFGVDVMAMNNFGCSLIWGHPQGPTGLRSIIELIEELALRGGGRGLFHGCAAGDTAMAVVIDVRDETRR